MRRTGTAVMLAGALLLAVPALPWARGQEGPDFGSFSLVARATGYDLIFDEASSPSHPAGQGTVPETAARLESGPIGLGFSSIVWPGPLAGNLGSLIVVSGGPPQATALNSPVRAEAHAPAGPADAENRSVPGATMAAHADEKLVTAAASMSGNEVPGVLKAGSVTTNTKSTLSADGGLSEATSVITDVALGPAGVLRIDSITSAAKGTTDGEKAAASGGTVVSGVTVAGQPATIDDRGIHFGEGSQDNPVAGVANQIGEQALRQAGITVIVTKPSTEELDGAGVRYHAGSVVFSWETGQGQSAVVTLGGATVAVTATPGFGSFEDGGGDTPAADPRPPGDTGGGTGTLPSGGDAGGDAGTGTGGLDPPDPGVTPDPGTGTAAPEVALGETPAANFEGLAPGMFVLALGAAMVVAGALRRLPDKVLSQPASSCNLEGDAR